MAQREVYDILNMIMIASDEGVIRKYITDIHSGSLVYLQSSVGNGSGEVYNISDFEHTLIPGSINHGV